MNTVIVSGNMTRDVEVRTTGSGLAVATGRVAVHNRKKEGNDWVDAPVFIDVVAFGEKGETFANNCKKGERVYVAGRLSYSEWEKDGQKRTKIEIMADRIETPNRTKPGERPTSSTTERIPEFDSAPAADDDIPF